LSLATGSLTGLDPAVYEVLGDTDQLGGYQLEFHDDKAYPGRLVAPTSVADRYRFGAAFL